MKKPQLKDYDLPNDFTGEKSYTAYRKDKNVWHKQKKKAMPDLKQFLTDEGYTYLKEIPNKGLCGIKRFIFTTGLVYGLNEIGYKGRYCHHSHAEALEALNNWNGQGHPKSNWVKHKGRDVDEGNPNYEKSVYPFPLIFLL